MSNYLPKILLTGACGQIGMALRHHPKSARFGIIPCSRDQLDISSLSSILQTMTAFSPDIVINAAGYTAVDKSEEEIDQTMEANHVGVQNLAIACNEKGVPLIHLSTDYIFDGTHTSPYQENEKANPINVYGQSKWLGEKAIREHCEQHIILRISGVFSEYGNNFLKTILRLAREKTELRVVADQITCPTYAGDIASLLFSIAQQLPSFGTYHYCNTAPVSWCEFATNIIQIAKQHQSLLVEKITAISAADYPTLAKRPAYSVLDCGKMKNEMRIEQSKWSDALTTIIPKMF